MEINSAWALILPYIDEIMHEEKLSYENYLKLHFHVVEYCTSIDNIDSSTSKKKEFVKSIKGGELYLKIKEYLSSYCNNLLEKSADLANEELLQFYTTKWKSYECSVQGLQICCSYLNKNWIKRNREMIGTIYVNEIALEIYNLAIVIWKDTFFNKHNTQLVDTAMSLINRRREGELVETTLIRELTSSCAVMGLYHDGETPSLILYKNQFEKQFLEMSEKFYELESENFLKDKTVSEYLKKVDERLLEEANNITLHLDPSTLQIWIKTVERLLIQNHLEKFLIEFRELLKLDKNDDLQLMYLLVNRNPEDMDIFIKEFQNFVKSEGMSRIERYGNVIKYSCEIYANTILEVYKKYLNMTLTVFENNWKFKTALEEACSNFVNRNFVTQPPMNVRKSIELITKFCDQSMKKSNSCYSDNPDQALEDLMILYRFITDKDVFQEYYLRFLSNRLLSPEDYDQNSEISMISKLKTDCGNDYALKLEKVMQDVAFSKEISTTFTQSNTEKLKVDFNVVVLQSGSWPFRKSPQYHLPLELEKCVSQFTQYYSKNHLGKKLFWMHNLCKGEIVTCNFKSRYTFQCNNMQIAILLLFNTSTSWSLTELHEKTNIELQLVYEIILKLLNTKIVTCKKDVSLTPDSIIFLNLKYKNKHRCININVPIESEDHYDKEALNINIDQERDYLIQAKIIQIMKAHKTLQHQDLISKTEEAFSSRFDPTVTVIKRIIETLVEGGFMERDDNTPGLYNYLP